MPYCKEFTQLLQSPESNISYPELFGTLNLFDANINPRLTKLDCNEIHLWLDGLFDKYIQHKDSIRPFHLGLGNPDANILVVGKELAINSNAPNPKQLSHTNCSVSKYYKKLFVNEAILNYFLWFYKAGGNKIPPNCCIQDPQFASSFCDLYNSEKKNGHYWAKMSKVVGAFLGRDIKYGENEAGYFRSRNYTESFFDHVFLTELHDIPSSYSPSHPNAPAIQQKIDELATIPFFKKFKRIVFACRTYLREQLPEYRKDIQKTYQTSLIQSDLSRNIKDVFSIQNQKIIVCNNLAGGAGWSNVELELLASLLK
jgi:hypothetical protein